MSEPQSAQEMTLEQWVERLPVCHSARKEYAKLLAASLPVDRGAAQPDLEAIALKIRTLERERDEFKEAAYRLENTIRLLRAERSAPPAQTPRPEDRCGNCDHMTCLHTIHGCTVTIQLENGAIVECPCAWDNLQASSAPEAEVKAEWSTCPKCHQPVSGPHECYESVLNEAQPDRCPDCSSTLKFNWREQNEHLCRNRWHGHDQTAPTAEKGK